MGFRSPVKRSTLADANEGRDWHIWEDLAALLIRRARKLYCSDSFGIDLDNNVYLNATTIGLCLSLFFCGAVSFHQGAVLQAAAVPGIDLFC